MATRPPLHEGALLRSAALEHAQGLAELAFGSFTHTVDLTRARHLALLPAEALELDLNDPAQRQFGDYELLELIGEGGMGVVYRARQVSLDREVAVKLLSAGPWASQEFIARFEREARNAARMQHPGIVTVYEVGSLEGVQFFSMRLVRGESLSARLKRGGRFTPREAAALMSTVAEAVGYAHSLGVLHLDLKPGNVLLDETAQPYVADFGLARRLGNALSVDNDEISGTPAYMAPEQADVRAQKLTAATDIWGLGAILYELLTGRPPFRADTARDTVELVLQGQVRAPRRWIPSLPLDLQAIVLRCLTRDPAGRYPTARALADDLARFIEGRPVRARPLSGVQRVARWARREPKFASVVGLAILALLGSFGVALYQTQRAEASARRATAVRNFLVGVFEQTNPDTNHGRPVTARQLLDQGERGLSAGKVLDPAVRADLDGVVGTLYWYIGDYQQADTLLRQAIANPHVPDDVRSRGLIAFAYTERERNRDDSAIAHARAGLALSRDPADAHFRSLARQTIARAMIDKDDAAGAEPLLRKALADDEARGAEADGDVVNDLTMLADALYELSRFDESITLSQRAIILATRRYGRTSTAVMGALEVLATAQKASGDLPAGERSLAEAVSIAEAIYGKQHRETIVAKSNLMNTLRDEGRYAEALRGHLEILRDEGALAATRPEQPGYTYNSIAADYLGLGRFKEAEDAARHAIAVWDSIDPNARTTISADSRDTLAAALQWQGRYAEAESEFRRALAIERQHEPASSLWLNRDRARLGHLLAMAHRYPQALVELRGALDALPPTPTLVRAGVLARLSDVELDVGHIHAALRHGEEALQGMRALAPAHALQQGGPLLADARAKLASGDAAAAEPLLREALAVRSPPYPHDDPRVLEVEVALAAALRAQGHDKEAGVLRGQIEPILRSQRTPYANDLLAQLK